MVTKQPKPSQGGEVTVPKEGQLAQVIRLKGEIFEIRYGYYEESDRHSRYAEPMELYPDFLKEPRYADDGTPFVTAMQDPCTRFQGHRNENSTCEECGYYRHGKELIGLCTDPKKKRNPSSS